jgi:hypothetical protein
MDGRESPRVSKMGRTYPTSRAGTELVERKLALFKIPTSPRATIADVAGNGSKISRHACHGSGPLRSGTAMRLQNKQNAHEDHRQPCGHQR